MKSLRLRRKISKSKRVKVRKKRKGLEGVC